MRYDEPNDGEWVYPVRRGYKLSCCDCGLTHAMDFGTVRCGKGYRIRFRGRRDERATAAVRREMEKRKGR